jgi:hypothetical protein
MPKYISIFGSREGFSGDDLLKIGQIAEFFAKKGWVLRTGGAIGIDDAGLNGFKKVANSKVELYLPWQGYNNHYNGILHTPENWEAASKYVGHWDQLKLNHRIFHARNVALILGSDNETPSTVAVCWTPEGKEVGGSCTGILVCKDKGIPLFNLGSKTGLTKLRKYCKKL